MWVAPWTLCCELFVEGPNVSACAVVQASGWPLVNGGDAMPVVRRVTGHLTGVSVPAVDHARTMTIDTESFSASRSSEESIADQGPIGRVAGASIVTGVAAAFVLTLVVCAGGTESTIMGCVLTAFGAGWAMLASLSTRRSTEPQNWARVPAAAMTVTGLALLALRPGGSVMTALNWVWPVPVLALAIWMRKRQRAAAPKRVRLLLAPITGVLVIASLGASYQNVASLHDASAYPAPGSLFEVDGHKLHLDCRGEGEPTTLLFNGMGGISASWAWVSDRVSRVGRVCAYDRAGQGWSEATDEPQDAEAAARDLHAVLARAGLEGPYVMAGHSTGGPFAMTYAATYPDEVAGMVLIDSSSPHQFSLPAYPGQYALMRRGLALTPTLWRLGLGHLGSAVTPSQLPPLAAAQVEALSANPRYARNQRDEISVLPRVFEQAEALRSLGSVPLAVLTASESATNTEGWTEAQDALALLSTDHIQGVVESSHAGMLEEEPAADEVARAVTEVIAAVRNHTDLSSR